MSLVLPRKALKLPFFYCSFFLAPMSDRFVFFVGDIRDDLFTQPESENTSKLSISDLLTNVATDANEVNRYVNEFI